jgi:zinc transport system substrate-binding protein
MSAEYLLSFCRTMLYLKSASCRSVTPRQLCLAPAAILLALGLGSCSPGSQSPPVESTTSSPATASSPDLQVVTTFPPITQFTKAVAGDRAEITQLLPPNIGPHDYQSSPADAQKLAGADVLVENGLEMEAFLDSLIDNAGNADLKVIDASEGVATIRTEDVEGDDHSHDHAGEEKAGEEKAGHDHGEFNPHVWLDPKRAMQQVENIRDGLIAADPDGKPVYTANAAAYLDQLKALDAEFTRQLQPFQGKTFVTYHDFAPYFADSYGLKTEFLVGIPEENASPEDVKRVIAAARDSNLKTLLTEPQAAGNPFSALAQDLNVQVSDFDPMETGGPNSTEPTYYLTTMRQNLKNLVAAFSP